MRPQGTWRGLPVPREDRMRGLVGRGGVEPPTFRFSGGRSYQLSYLPRSALRAGRAVPTGFEPATFALTGRRALRTAPRDLM